MTYHVSLGGQKVVSKPTWKEAVARINKFFKDKMPKAKIKWIKLGGCPQNNCAYPVKNGKRINFYCRITDGKDDGAWKNE